MASPASVLAHGLRLEKEGRLAEIAPLIDLVRKEELLSYWGILIEGRIAEHKGRLAEATRLYKEVPPDSAAAIDAHFALLRLSSSSPQGVTLSDLEDLEEQIILAKRQDLLEDFLLLRAAFFESQAQLEQANKTLLEIQKRFPKNNSAKLARARQEELWRRNPSFANSFTPSFLLEQAAIFLPEDLPDEALQSVQRAKTLLTEKSAEYFQALLLEEQILRALKRHEEADRLLLIISADGGLGAADQALLKIATNAWNINDHQSALTFLDNLKQRFPLSPLISQGAYIEARILEELPQLAEAKGIYEQLSLQAPDQLTRIRALIRIAWLFLRSENYQVAAQYLAQAHRKIHETSPQSLSTEKALAKPSPPAAVAETTNYGEDKDSEALAAEEQHVLYWLAVSLQKLDQQAREQLGFNETKLSALLDELPNRYPRSYYSMLLQKLPSPPSAEKTTVVPAEADCKQAVPEILHKRLALLSKAGLAQLAKYEIDWYFAHAVSPQKEEEIDFFASAEITRAQLHLDYAFPQTAMAIAEVLLPKDSLDASSEMNIACLTKIQKLLYPTPFQPLFSKAVTKEPVPLALLYALSRTESSFNPSAVSAAGALGLTQLLKNTAKMEGWNGQSDLSDPELNVQLGAKHLRRLLGEHKGNKILALAAYNAGSAAVNRWLARFPNLDSALWLELIGYPETKNYVKQVLLAESVYEKEIRLAQEKTKR